MPPCLAHTGCLTMIDAYILWVCGFFWGLQSVPPTTAQKDTCADVTIAAVTGGHDPTMILSIAWQESRFIPKKTSGAGAKGPMQVMPKYWCPNKRPHKCDLVIAGLLAWRTYLKRSKSVADALCRYGSGRPCVQSKGARRYARRVLATRAKMLNALTGGSP